MIRRTGAGYGIYGGSDKSRTFLYHYSSGDWFLRSIYDIWDAEGAVYLSGSYGAVPEAFWDMGASDFYSDSDSSGGDSHHTGRSFLSGRRASVRAAVGICL